MTLAFWSAVALLLAGALLFVLPPLLRPSGRTQTGPSPLTVYREQRAQFDAELAQGTLTAEQHAKALEELQDRVVDEVGELPETAVAPSSQLPPVASILALALLLPAGALGVYAVLGKPAALAPAATQAAATSGDAPHTMSREQMEQMVERLAERLKKTPQDADGWHMLARSYVSFGRLPEAAQAYDRASSLSPKDPQLLADYADTLAMINGRSLEGRPLQLVNEALKLDPAHPKSLALSGTAAFNRGDFAAALTVWQKLLASLPPDSEQARSLATSIAQAQAGAAKVPGPPGTGGEQPLSQATAKPATSATPAAQAGPASVEGSVTISDALKPRVAPGTTLFVFARAVNGPRMPLAITRVPAGQFPYQFKLDDSSAMTPQFKLSGQAEVILGARISRSGNATPQSGDLMGTLGPVAIGSRNLKLVIDGVVP
jgi:cytochrome c-type biogenesis protein CcmH